MTHEQILKKFNDRFTELNSQKFIAGQKEHGGTITDKGKTYLIEAMEEEILDMWNYLQALKEIMDD
jgi:hypothetical protein